MAMLSQLTGQIITVLCVTALLEQLLPHSGTTLRYVRIFTGLFILVSLLNPLVRSFDLWEQSFQGLDTAWSASEKVPSKSSLQPLQQKIELPEYVLANLPLQDGSHVSRAEVVLENQSLRVVNLWLMQAPQQEEIFAEGSTDQQEALCKDLSEVLGFKLQPEQINLIITEAK